MYYLFGRVFFTLCKIALIALFWEAVGIWVKAMLVNSNFFQAQNEYINIRFHLKTGWLYKQLRHHVGAYLMGEGSPSSCSIVGSQTIHIPFHSPSLDFHSFYSSYALNGGLLWANYLCLLKDGSRLICHRL